MRSKWFAIACSSCSLAYEQFGLWIITWTVWIMIGYFVAAFVIDAFFRAQASANTSVHRPVSFYQLHGFATRSEGAKPDVCASCKTHDCLRGNERQRGCEQIFICRAKWETWIAPFASTACELVHTTMWACSQSLRKGLAPDPIRSYRTILG